MFSDPRERLQSQEFADFRSEVIQEVGRQGNLAKEQRLVELQEDLHAWLKDARSRTDLSNDIGPEEVGRDWYDPDDWSQVDAAVSVAMNFLAELLPMELRAMPQAAEKLCCESSQLPEICLDIVAGVIAERVDSVVYALFEEMQDAIDYRNWDQVKAVHFMMSRGASSEPEIRHGYLQLFNSLAGLLLARARALMAEIGSEEADGSDWYIKSRDIEQVVEPVYDLVMQYLRLADKFDRMS